jgi:type I restriction enzyme S subunit
LTYRSYSSEAWPRQRFGNFYAEPSRNGITKPKGERGHGVKMVNMGELFAFPRLYSPDMARVSLTDSERLRFLIKPRDLLFARRSLVLSGAGKCAIIMDVPEPTTFESSIIRVRIDQTKSDPLFWYYYFTSQIGRADIEAIVTQLNVSGIRSSELSEISVLTPPLTIQHRIAAILSAYDDLIELNARRIEIVEEMARRLFQEWFVEFRFPGHDPTHLNTVAARPLPKGWRTGSLQDVIVLQRGFDLPTNTRSPGPYPVIAATGIHGTHAEAKVSGPCVVTGRSGSLGTVLHIDGDFWPLNTTLWGKEFPLGSTYHAFFVLQGIDLKGRNAGAAVPTLNRNDIHKLPVPVPPSEIITKFDSHVVPLFDLKKTLTNSNNALRRARDLLLPKLILGQINLSDTETELEPNRVAAE